MLAWLLKRRFATLYLSLVLLAYIPCAISGPSPQALQALALPSFHTESQEQLQTAWGQEMHIACQFGKEKDYYRSITALKRALFLLPEEAQNMRAEIEYGIFLNYFLAQRWQDAIETFQSSSLPSMDRLDPLYRDSLIMLFECFSRQGAHDVADSLLATLSSCDQEAAAKLKLAHYLLQKDFTKASTLQTAPPYYDKLLQQWQKQKKSPHAAGLLNALLPGAGYFYVGQKSTALSAFLINSLFMAATYQCFHHGNTAAGIILANVELGWYFGGIRGAVKAARHLNQSLAQDFSDKITVQENLFPVLMLHYAF